MLKNQCISVTKLRTRTKECLNDLEKEPKFIFVNNEPVAVLLDIEDYELHFTQPILRELGHDEIIPSLKQELAMLKRKTRKKELIDI